MARAPSARSRRVTSRCSQSVIAGRAAAYDRDARFPTENYQDLHRTGLLGIAIPRKHGGLGADYQTYAIAAAEIGRYCGATALTWNMHVCSTLWSGPLADDLDMDASMRAEHERRRVEQVIEFLDLEAYRDKLISGLPYGVRKVIELARALCSEPKLILLDEPSSGLNVEETDDMSFWIRDMKSELGITVVMVEHDMTLVNRVSDRVIALNYGRVLAMGTAAEVQSHPDVVAAYLGA